MLKRWDDLPGALLRFPFLVPCNRGSIPLVFVLEPFLECGLLNHGSPGTP